MIDKKRVIFLCSNLLHLKLFLPTIEILLSSNNVQPVIALLDNFYELPHKQLETLLESKKLLIPVERLAVSSSKKKTQYSGFWKIHILLITKAKKNIKLFFLNTLLL